jgi:hypothetical protein
VDFDKFPCSEEGLKPHLERCALSATQFTAGNLFNVFGAQPAHAVVANHELEKFPQPRLSKRINAGCALDGLRRFKVFEHGHEFDRIGSFSGLEPNHCQFGFQKQLPDGAADDRN